MPIDDKIKALTKQLFPTGRVWRINPNGIKEEFTDGLLASEIRAYNDAVSILDSSLPDNPNFTVDDASAWEKRLGLPDGTGVPLDQRMDAIKVQLNWPGTNPAKGAADYIQAILQAAGYNTCVQENLFLSPASAWTLGSITSDPNDIGLNIIFGNGVFIIIGNISGTVFTSSNGASWSSVGSVGAGIVAFGYGANLYVACTSNGVFYSSPDLVTWTLRYTSPSPGSTVMYKIIFAGGQFVAINRSGSGNFFFTSPDGITWTQRTIPLIGSDWRDIAYSGSVYCVVSASGSAMTSSDGITWANSILPAAFYGLAYGNNKFVAVGASITATSPDGISWTTTVPPTSNQWYDVIFANDLFTAISVQVGIGNRVMTSSDGSSWTIGVTPEDDFWQSIAFGNNTLVASGGKTPSDKPVSVMYSTQGSYYHKTFAQFAGSDFVRYKSTLQYGQQNYGMLRTKGLIVANSIDPNVDDTFDIGDGSDTIFIGGCPPGTYINIPKSQETAFRQFILKIKPVNITVLLLVNFV